MSAQNTAPYSVFARVYDNLMESACYEQRANRICALLHSNGVCEGDILDMACGTGQLLPLLEKQGYSMIGIDKSPEMLTAARENCYAAGSTPLLLCQDMQVLDLYGTVDGAVCIMDSLNHLPNLSAIRKTLARLHVFLRPGGIFLFDVNTVHKHQNILADNCFVLETQDVYCVWQNEYRKRLHTVQITLDFFMRQGNVYRRESEQFQEHAYSLASLTRVLQETGFEPLGIYDDLTDLPADEKSERALFVVKTL